MRFLLPSIQSHGALPAAVISGVINSGGGALPAAAFLSPPPIAVIYRRHLKHCAITGAIITAHGGVSFAVSFAVNTIARRITGGGYIRHYQFGGGGALPAAAFLSPPPIAVIYRRHLLSAP